MLFPPISISSPVYSKADTIFLIEKSRDITFRFQQSPFFIKRKVEENDIVRYSDKRSTTKRSVSMIQYLGDKIADMDDYIPAELLSKRPGRVSGRSSSSSSSSSVATTAAAASTTTKRVAESIKDSSAKTANARVDINLGRLEQQESAETAAKNADKDDGSDVEAADGDDPDEFELDDDYGVDHYASDGGGDSNSDNEATF